MEIDFSSFSLEQPCLYDLPEFHDFVLDFSLQSNSITNHSNYNNDSPSSTEKDKSELIQFVMSCCSKFVEQNSDCFLSAPDLFQEVLSIIDKGRNQTMHSDSEMYFQDKLFQLLGENCFEFLSEMLSRFSDLQKLSTDSISSTDLISKAGSSHSATVKTTNTITTNLSTNQDWLAKLGFSEEYLSTERSLGLQKGNSFDVASWNLLPEGTRIHHEIKGLPMDTIKTVGPGFEEVFIPAARNPPIIPPGGLTSISTLEPWAQKAFVGTSSLNTIQSTVFPAVYNTSQNLLICAPTGAGKTNIAMLAILQLLRDNYTGNGHIDVSGVKAIYIAPMKALAQEIVARFSERLKSLGMSVRECTGDMQLTKQETMETNLIVTTPEKYDVISRKCTEGSLSTMVSLIIIDEVHLLADDRGAVIETIVARTHRYIESSQKRIRLVGLSATLPNYEDVAKFLRANLKTGLFYFGPEYRPVPLAQTLIGVTEKQKPKQKAMMNLKAYEKMIESLEKGKQVMIFVHSRKETSETANAMVEFSAMRGTLGHFDSSQHEKYGLWKKDVDKAHSEEVQNLFYKGVGIHHAGMMRSDRTLTENLFQYGLIKVLCCTATLAWGVNLPANTVIIKGTELYDPERGGFVDLSILDVLQIFGRAGRPQYDTSGNAVLITPHKSLDSYLALLGHQSPIESGLIKSLADHLNAEIVNGTVANVNDAIAWLTYTFLFVRMCKNPLCYGLKMDDVMNDPQLTEKRRELIVQAAQLLDRCMMCRYDPGSGNLGVTDLGRVASHYYLKYGTIEAFNSMLSPHLSDVEALQVLCSSSEFDQLKLRPEELAEIDALKKRAPVTVKIPVEETAGKVNVLLQSYIGQNRVSSFTLISDINYVAQNAGRITRALFEICLKRGWSTLTSHYLELCKCIDRRIRADQTPLRQFYYDALPQDVIRRLEELKVDVNKLIDMTPREIGELCHNQKVGEKILSLVKKLPYLSLEIQVQPITRTIIRIIIDICCDFEWSDKYHGSAECFWIWIEDGDNEYIYSSQHFILSKSRMSEKHRIDVTIPVRQPLPPQYYIRCVSDKWMGCTTVETISFKHLILPELVPANTDLQNIHPVPVSALKNVLFESIYTKFSHFNPIQSQVFHTLYHGDGNCLVGAPTGSGKTIMSELAILRLITANTGGKIVYVAPLKALARERTEDWKEKLGKKLGLSIVELTGDFTPHRSLLEQADLFIVTPEKWDSISRGWQSRDYVKKVELVIIDEIHLLGVERGAVLEVIVSRMRLISEQMRRPIRFIGLSTALANARDLGDWLGVPPVGMYNFRPSVRPVPMTVHIHGFPTKAFCPRNATMNRPAYAAICEHSPTKPALIFVSSRRQTRLTALDLISFCASEDNPKKFLHMPEQEVQMLAETIKDSALRDTLVFGIALHHAGLDAHDKRIVEELFLECKIQVLVATSTLAWGVNLPCHLVIVKDTVYYDGKTKRYVDFPVTDILQMMGRAGRPQFDNSGTAVVLVHEPMKNFYRNFLFQPFPCESSLSYQLHEHINAEIVTGVIQSIDDCLEYLSWTFFYRRLVANPSYYKLEECSSESIARYLTELVSKVTDELAAGLCIESNDGIFKISNLGRITSHYYLCYKTVGLFTRGIQSIADFLTSDHSSSVAVSRLVNTDANYAPTHSILEMCAKLMCDAYEFSEVPVRHNEDILNAELSTGAPWSVDSRTLGESNTKAYLLIQAHLFGLPLPILDYINDTKSVLDQVPRVLNALIDVASHMGELTVVTTLMKLSQLIFQALPLDASELRQLPGIESEDDIAAFKRAKVTSLRSLLRLRRPTVESMLMSLPTFKRKSSLMNEAFRFLGNIPIYDAKMNVTCTFTSARVEVPECVFGDESTALPIITLPLDTECTLEIQFTQTHGNSQNHGRPITFHDPKYHKAKEASWWVVLGSMSTNELLVTKRTSIASGRQASVTVEFVTSIESIPDDMCLFVLSDCLIGVDMKYAFTIQT